MDFTADGRFLMLNSSGMDMIVVNAETCKKASPKDMKALRYYFYPDARSKQWGEEGREVPGSLATAVTS